MKILRLLSILLVVVMPARASAYRFGVSGGSVGLSNGHPNAADFRSINNYKAHLTIADVDVSLATTQALVGRVFEFKSGAFVIPAAGLVLDGNGSGPGFSATFGWTAFCWGICLYVELQNMIGAGPNRHLVSGSAARIGLDYSSN
ncbi:MAG: hypothetical protein RLZZ488_98 [Pseudomonadota bacterium]|jgi:hypothetical protein